MLVKNGYVTDFEARFYRKDGTEGWASLSLSINRSALCGEDIINGFASDISGTQTGGEELRKANLFRYKIINTIPDPLVVKDKEHRYVLVNDALCELLQRDSSEIVGKTCHDLFPENEADLSIEMDGLVFEFGREVIYEVSIIDHCGLSRIFVVKKTLYMDESGEIFVVRPAQRCH